MKTVAHFPRKVLGIAIALFLAACGESGQQGASVSPATCSLQAPVSRTQPYFTDVSQSAGIDFRHINGMTNHLYILEAMGSGGAFIDYDNDGDLDIFLVQGGYFDPSDSRSAQAQPGDRLYRNDLKKDENGCLQLRFTDVTQTSGLNAQGYGMGVAVGDFDRDGWQDLYVTRYGRNILYRNNGNGSFSDVTDKAGVGDVRWSTSASFADIDDDGWLDLYVCNYIDFRLPGGDHNCYAENTAPDYCGPLKYRPQPDTLYRNLGDGRFLDISLPSGINNRSGNCLGVIAADFNDDGKQDFYVANDAVENYLWINRGDLRFEDRALSAGVAVNGDGSPEASMGVDAADFDVDGDLDIFLSHLLGETNTLYVNQGNGAFVDGTMKSGLGVPSWGYTGFGVGWLDYDNDGILDLLVANGGMNRIAEQIKAGDEHPLRQASKLYRGIRGGRFVEQSAQAGADLTRPGVGRGAAFGDVDNDGDTDVLMTFNNGRPRLLINRVGQNNSWIGVELLAEHSGDPVSGAMVNVVTANGRGVRRYVHNDGSYLSASDPRIRVGLGESPGPVQVEVRWPDGRLERWSQREAGRYYRLHKGQGESLP